VWNQYSHRVDAEVTFCIYRSVIASPKIWRCAKWLILGEKHYFVWENASQSTKWLHVLNVWGHGPFGSPGYAYDIQIPNLISTGVLRATLIMLCFDLADDLHINILIFVAGHGTVVQPASINIVFGCKQAQQYRRTYQLGFIRAVSWCAQNAESHCSHVHITLIVEHFSFHAFHKKCGLGCTTIWCLVQVA